LRCIALHCIQDDVIIRDGVSVSCVPIAAL
jgi:hypothetical protein